MAGIDFYMIGKGGWDLSMRVQSLPVDFTDQSLSFTHLLSL